MINACYVIIYRTGCCLCRFHKNLETESFFLTLEQVVGKMSPCWKLLQCFVSNQNTGAFIVNFKANVDMKPLKSREKWACEG